MVAVTGARESLWWAEFWGDRIPFAITRKRPRECDDSPSRSIRRSTDRAKRLTRAADDVQKRGRERGGNAINTTIILGGCSQKNHRGVDGD